ncbi:MAG: hypothetical protein VYC39_06690 [Myxococcota bacterium]|nr:hypothetical protein [Myxococcota bacterium]
MTSVNNYEELDEVIRTLYECMSFASGEMPDYQRCRILFCRGASVIPPSDDSIPASAISVDEFFETSKVAIESSQELQSRGLNEREIYRKVNEFGSVAQVFSTYESRVEFSDYESVGKGVNSISLVFQDSRWWILSLSWDDESPELQLPDDLLPSP